NKIDKLAEINAQDSIGILYSTPTLHLGFDFNSVSTKSWDSPPTGIPLAIIISSKAVKVLDNGLIKAANHIKAGHVLGWYRGRMEFGPRALGYRSILAAPGHPEMRDRLNAMVKRREAFGP